MKQYLALFRAGPSSLHGAAVERLAEQNFDYALSWFGDEAPKMADGAVFVRAVNEMSVGAAKQAWDTAKPLFDKYPDVYAVQDLRCQLAILKRLDANEQAVHCAALKRLSPSK